ncbi:MAG TPA: DUF5106 domain-containing protein [Saprospiraceae bacterium]|jgi:thiol-disulfide isomerase/thioredoxin|nr:redoxin family protein [Saprospiraceae bacterium]HRO09331.1 DUF5106 domain-containing protein [Saprospiraceae bacterium]HRO72287.1 DUF5106 domain-containing protein [Saprospiraceae bacterium]HRP42568.1 DUF5106 domain-containing protein [Saprospiraceae bacterium]
MKISDSCLVLLISFFSLGFVSGQSFEYTFNIKNYTSDTLIIGSYYGERQIAKDTLYGSGKGKFLWSGKEMPPQGVYMLLMKPSNTFIQFMINGKEPKFELTTDYQENSATKFKGSKENDLFYGYMDYLKDKRTQADTLRARIERARKAGQKDVTDQKSFEDLDEAVKKAQHELIEKNPFSLTALLLKGSSDIDVPEFEGLHADTIKVRRYYYYKEHYFDNIDMNNPALIRTPFFHQKLDTYINKVVNQHPDTLIKALDFVLSKLENNSEIYRYYLAEFLNKYASMKMVGYDAMYVHLVDNYYLKGKAPWISEENMTKMRENANDLRPVLIGNKMPDITTYMEDGSPVRIWDVQSPYTVVLFWAPDCGHCQKSMPFIIDFYNKYKDKGVKLISVCTKPGEKMPTCWPALEKEKMGDFINTADEYSRYNMKVKIKATPKLFILDADKKIIIKDIPAEEMEKVFQEILSIDQKIKEEKLR